MSLAQPLHRGKQSVLSNPEHLRCLFQEVLGVQPRKGLSSPPRGSWLSELGLRARTEPAQELGCHSAGPSAGSAAQPCIPSLSRPWAHEAAVGARGLFLWPI